MAINSFLVDQQMSLLSNISFSFCLFGAKIINKGSAVGGVLFTMGTRASVSAMMGVGLARVHGETLLADQLRAAGKPKHTRHVVMATASQMHDDPNNKHALSHVSCTLSYTSHSHHSTDNNNFLLTYFSITIIHIMSVHSQGVREASYTNNDL